MATKDIVLQPGEALPPSIQNAFAEAFGTEVLANARDRGAKLRLVLTSPWPKPARAKRPKKIIDQSFVDRLKTLASDEGKLEAEVNTLSGPEILKIASLLEVPMSKSSKLSSLRAQLQKTLRSEIVWKGIAGQHGVVADAQATESTSTAGEPTT
jgi:hypothetical protein